MLPERKRHEIEKQAELTLQTALKNASEGARLDVFAIAKNCGYTLRKYSDFTLEEIIGFFIKCNYQLPPGLYIEKKDGKKIIFYNNILSINEVSYTIVHELGHGELGHKECCSLAEREADYFAESLLSKLSGVNPVKPECTAITLDSFRDMGKWGVVLLGAAFIYYAYKKSRAA